MDTAVTLDKQPLTSFDYELVPTPCCRVRMDGMISECNILVTELVGSSKASLIHAPILDIIDARSHADVRTALSSLARNSTSSSSSTAIWIRGRNGHANFPCALYFRAIRGDAGDMVAVNITLIDERQYNAQIEQMQRDKEHLKKIEILKDEFIAVASHELRTPIQPILGFAMLAKKGLMTEEMAWDGVLKEARRLQQLATDILDVSRIDAGSLKYRFEKEKINELLQSFANSTRPELPIEINLNVLYDEAESDVEVEIDRSRITQVMSNLVSNAVKFTEKGAITVETKRLTETSEFEIRVTDTGRGLSEEILPVLFDKFATKGHGTVKNNKGTGLGLYITKAIVEAHKGKITAHNNVGGGATFVVTLPISQPTA